MKPSASNFNFFFTDFMYTNFCGHPFLGNMNLWKLFNINQEDEVINNAENNKPGSDIVIVGNEVSDTENAEARCSCVYLPAIAKQIVYNLLKNKNKKRHSIKEIGVSYSTVFLNELKK